MPLDPPDSLVLSLLEDSVDSHDSDANVAPVLGPVAERDEEREARPTPRGHGLSPAEPGMLEALISVHHRA